MSVVAPHREQVYRDRSTGDVLPEPVFSEGALRFFYEHPLGRPLFRVLFNRAWFSRLYGKLQETPGSREKIAPFVACYGVRMDEVCVPEGGFASFNDFFTRKLTPGARPFPADAAVLASPGDGKLLVYPHLAPETRLPVKGCNATLAELFASAEQARAFEGGSALVLRLAVQDYHRFHFPFGGTAGQVRAIAGRYHSVGPIALARVPDLFVRNKRALTLVDTPEFGCVAYLEVGALCVGAIHQTYAPGAVTRGQEKGYFSFGGSTLVLVFEPGAVAFDEDLLADSSEGLEVRVLAGTPIGRRAHGH